MTDEIDEIYRRAAALDPSRPSDAARRKVLAHAAAVASSARAQPRLRRRPAMVGILAAAALAGLLVIPRIFNPRPAADSADVAARPDVPPNVAARTDVPPDVAARTDVPLAAAAPPLAGAGPRTQAPSIQDEPARAAGRSMNSAPSSPLMPSRTAEQSRAAASGGMAADAVARKAASPPVDRAAALRRAAQAGDVPMLREILGEQVRIDAPDGRGRTALLLAALAGRDASVDLLLARGADPNAADDEGMTPLRAAADRPAIAAALRRAGAH